MNRKQIRKSLSTSINIISILIFFMIPFHLFGQRMDLAQQNQLKFGRLLKLIDSYYVDTTNIDKITEKAIVSMLGELDPHSAYISKEEVEKANEPLVGNFEGIGISFNIHDDTLLVSTIISGGPSERVGLLPGDRIIIVDEKQITNIKLTNEDVFKLLRGKKGTTVKLKVLRKSDNRIFDFTIIWDKIPIYSIDASFKLNESTGYIKLNRFSATTTDEFVTAINNLKKENIKSLVLDLRGNGGGYLNQAVEIADQFLKENDLIVFTSGVKEERRDYNSTSKGDFEKGNLVVLVDENSASASEIVSGAIQDWDRGVIIGRRTFGKGLVQKPFYLTDGSVVRLTTSHYYTPSGRCIQKPYSNGTDEYRQDYMERIKHGEMFNKDSMAIDKSQVYKTLLNNRKVFGGGGVIPDIFIPLDTSSHYAYLNQLQRNNIVYYSVVDYIDKNRKALLEKYPVFNNFNKNFVVPDGIIDNIVNSGIKANIPKNEVSLAFSLPNLKKQVKALIARDIYSLNDYFKIIFEDDKAIIKSLEILKNQKDYNELLVTVN